MSEDLWITLIFIFIHDAGSFLVDGASKVETSVVCKDCQQLESMDNGLFDMCKLRSQMSGT